MTVKEFLENGKKAYVKVVTQIDWNLNGYNLMDDAGQIDFDPFDEALEYGYDNNRYNIFTVFEPCTFEVTFEDAKKILEDNYDSEDIEGDNVNDYAWLLKEVGSNFKQPSKSLKIGYKEANLSKHLKFEIEKEHDFIEFQTEEEYYKPLKDAIYGYEAIECHLGDNYKASWTTLECPEVTFDEVSLDDICIELEQEKCVREIFGFLTLEDYVEYKEGGVYKGDFIGMRSDFFED